jgi:hypothetical protein
MYKSSTEEENPFMMGPTEERWRCLMKDNRFNSAIALSYFNLGLPHIIRSSFLEIVTEYAAVTGSLEIIQFMYPDYFMNGNTSSALIKPTLPLWYTPMPIDETLLQACVCNQPIIVSYLLPIFKRITDSLQLSSYPSETAATGK